MMIARPDSFISCEANSRLASADIIIFLPGDGRRRRQPQLGASINIKSYLNRAAFQPCLDYAVSATHARRRRRKPA